MPQSRVAYASAQLYAGPGSYTKLSYGDLIQGLRSWPLWGLLGWIDIRQRYRRSKIGPFWLTISMGITVVTLGVLYSFLFRISTEELLPWLTAGFIVWAFINNTITESCSCFIAAEGYIKQIQFPLTVHLFRVIWRNAITMAHNLIILPFVYLFYGKEISIHLLLVVPGFALLLANLIWIGLFLGVICTRFRDLPQIMASIIQIGFYVTPILWKPELLPESWHFFLNLNPFYHLVELLRAPLLGTLPYAMSWFFAAISLFVGGAASLAIYARFHRRIAYWL